MVLCQDVFQLFLPKMNHLFLMMFHQQRKVERCPFFDQELKLECIKHAILTFKPIISNKNITHVKTPNEEVSMFLTFYGGTSKMNQYIIVGFGLIELRFLYLLSASPLICLTVRPLGRAQQIYTCSNFLFE